jgi:hypothetical protein
MKTNLEGIIGKRMRLARKCIPGLNQHRQDESKSRNDFQVGGLNQVPAISEVLPFI